MLIELVIPTASTLRLDMIRSDERNLSNTPANDCKMLSRFVLITFEMFPTPLTEVLSSRTIRTGRLNNKLLSKKSTREKKRKNKNNWRKKNKFLSRRNAKRVLLQLLARTAKVKAKPNLRNVNYLIR
jgi:hypothetical protein